MINDTAESESPIYRIGYYMAIGDEEKLTKALADWKKETEMLEEQDES